MTTWYSPARTRAAAVALASLMFWSAAYAQQRPNLTVAVNSLGSKMDPADTPFAVELRVYGSVFDNLIRRDYAAETANPSKGVALVPALATDWKRIDDRTVELNLRHGVKFHNGDNFTADDVAFTFSPERIFGEKAMLPSAKSFFGCWEPVEILSQYQVRIKACQADPVIELKLAHYSAGIVSKRAYKEVGQAAFKLAPVGTGPLKFVEWKTGDYIKFNSFDDFWGGKPNFASMTFREVPETSARVAGLVSGGFDIVTQITPSQFSVIDQHNDLKVLPALLDQFQFFWMVGNEPAISDKRVRQALALAVNRDAIVKAIWDGKTTAENQLQLPSLGTLYNKDRRGIGYDPEAAKKLLKEAGYNGQPVNIRILANYYVNGETIVQAIQSMWQAIGVNAKVQVVENWTQAFAPGASAVMGGCGFDMPAPESLASCFFGEKALIRQRGFPNGIAGLDALSDKLATNDEAERKKVFAAMLDVFDDEVPAILLYRTPQFFAARQNVQWMPTADFRTDFRPNSLSIKANAN